MIRKKLAAAAISTSLLAGAYISVPSLLPLTEAAMNTAVQGTETGPTTAAPGSVITHTVTMTETTGMPANNLAIVDIVDARLQFLPSQSSPGCVSQGTGADGLVIQCPTSNFAPHQSKTYIFAYQVPLTIPCGTDLMESHGDVTWDQGSNWTNMLALKIVCPAAAGHSDTVITSNANTTVNNQVNAGSQNNTQVWQQEQNNMPFNAVQNANINPTANTTVNNQVNAGSQNNTAVAQPGGWWSSANIHTNANTTVNNGVNAAAQNNTQLWQQQQSNMPWWSMQSATINPMANTTVNNGINAGSFNWNAVWQH